MSYSSFEFLLDALLIIIPLSGIIYLWRDFFSKFSQKYLIKTGCLKRAIRVAVIIVSTLLVLLAGAIASFWVYLMFMEPFDPNDADDAWTRDGIIKTMAQNRINGMHDIMAIAIVALILVAFALLYKRRVKLKCDPGSDPHYQSAVFLMPWCVIAVCSIFMAFTWAYQLQWAPQMFMGGMGGPAPTPHPRAKMLANRITLNDPTGPKTYGDLLKAMGTTGRTEYDKYYLQQEALELLLAKAEEAKDIDLLACYLTSDNAGMRINAAFSIRHAGASVKTLTLWSDVLNKSTYKDMKLQASYGLGRVDEHHGHIIDKTMPKYPSPYDSKAMFDSRIIEWRTWWDATKEKTLSQLKAKENTTTSPEPEP